jgi:hypothetical protein
MIWSPTTFAWRRQRIHDAAYKLTPRGWCVRQRPRLGYRPQQDGVVGRHVLARDGVQRVRIDQGWQITGADVGVQHARNIRVDAERRPRL